MTDAELIQQYVRHGSEAAFSQLVTRHLAFVYRVCCREVADPQIAEDAALAVFLLLSKKAGTIRPSVQVTSWLFSVARLTARNAARQERQRQAREQKAVEMAEVNVRDTDPAMTDFADTHLNDALAALSGREREAVLLRYCDGLEVTEVARTLGITVSAAQMRLSRSLEKMRHLFTRRGTTLSAATISAVLLAQRSQSAPITLLTKATALSSAGFAAGAGSGVVALSEGALKTMELIKLKTAAAVAATCLVAGGTASYVSYARGAGHGRTSVTAAATADSQNAFDYYVRAGKMAQEPPTTTTVQSPASDATVAAENQDALRVMRQGFAFAYQNPPITAATVVPYYGDFRKLARILIVEGRVKATQGDWAGATESGLDAVRLGTDIPHGNPAIGDLVGLACNSIGRKFVWSTLPRLSAKEAVVAEQRLEKIDAGRASFGDVMRAEKIMTLSVLAPAPASSRQAYAVYLDKWISTGSQFYSAKTAIPTEPAASDPITTALVGSAYARIWAKDTADCAHTRLLEAGLALQAYHADTGHYPKSLDALVPKYVAQVPADPFAQNAPLQYHTNGDGYSLYSVGPDGVDNGGTPMNYYDPDTKTYQPRNMDEHTTGDLLAGVNGW